MSLLGPVSGIILQMQMWLWNRPSSVASCSKISIFNFKTVAFGNKGIF